MCRHLLLIAAVTGLALASTAAAAPDASIRSVDLSGYPIVRVTVATARGSGPPPALTENTAPVPAPRMQNLGRSAKAIVLAIDRSQSMRGAPLADAVAGVDAFLQLKRQADEIEIVTVAHVAIAQTGFSDATIDADTALRTVGVDGTPGTALYDSVVLAAAAVRAQPLVGRVLIVLTDGRDVGSTATLASAITAARDAHLLVYPIALGSAATAPLRLLAGHTGGRLYTAATSSALASIYRTISAELGHTWLITYATALRPGQKLTLRLPGLGTRGVARVTPGSSVSLPSGLLPSRATRGALGWVLIALAAASSFAAAAALLLRRSRITTLRRRVDSYRDLPQPAHVRHGRYLPVLSSLFATTEQALGRTRRWMSVEQLLERSGLPLRAAEFVYLSLGTAFAAALAAALTASTRLVILFAFALGALVPYAVARSREANRRRAFDAQLPHALSTISSAMKAGHSLKHGIEAVATEGKPPLSTEFARVLAEARLGRPLDEALADVVVRVRSSDLDYVVTALAVQSQIGGALSGLLDMVEETVRQRQRHARRLKSLTAMGRMSAYVVLAVPFALGLLLSALSPSYLNPLFHDSTGHILLVYAAVSICIGALFLKKIVTVKG